MPAITTLAFYREQQTIDSFEEQRPKSIAAFRGAVQRAINEIYEELAELEKSYIGPEHDSMDDFIRTNMYTVRRLLTAGDMKELRRSFDIDNLIEMVNSLGANTVVYVEDMAHLKEIQTHVDNIVPASFYKVLERLNLVLRLMWKYCLSFYTGPTHVAPDSLLDTPFKYEQRRRIMVEDLQRYLRGVSEKPTLYRSIGLDFEKLSHNVKGIGRRCGCVTAPFLLLFSEAKEGLLEATKVITLWLEEDREYMEGLTNDLNSMQVQLDNCISQHREFYVQLHKNKHRLQGLDRDIVKHKEGEREFVQRSLRAKHENHRALVELKKVQFQFQRSRTKLSELKKSSEYLPASELKPMRDEAMLSGNLAKMKLPKLAKKLHMTDEKVKYMEDVGTSFKNKVSESQVIKEDIHNIERKLRNIEADQQRLEKYQKIVRQILVLKTSPETLKKVHHNLQLESRLKWLTQTKEEKKQEAQIDSTSAIDPLDVTIRVTAKYIEQDWCKLYFSLPFHPQRGEHELQQDLDKIYKKYVRGSRTELAKAALLTWRRLHIRANKSGLMDALEHICRPDVLRRVEYALMTPEQRAMQREEDREAANAHGEISMRMMTPTSRLLYRRKMEEQGHQAQQKLALPELAKSKTMPFLSIDF